MSNHTRNEELEHTRLLKEMWIADNQGNEGKFDSCYHDLLQSLDEIHEKLKASVKKPVKKKPTLKLD